MKTYLGANHALLGWADDGGLLVRDITVRVYPRIGKERIDPHKQMFYSQLLPSALYLAKA